MKNKITHFLLMASFLISAISCSVDEQEPSNLPISSGIPAKYHGGFYKYTKREEPKLRTALYGTYKCHRVTILDVKKCWTKLYSTYGGTIRPEKTYRSEVNFINGSYPILTVIGEDKYFIVYKPNKPFEVQYLVSNKNPDLIYYKR